MAVKPGKIYMGRRSRRAIAAAIVFIAALLLVAAAVIFDSLQKYIVYGPDGLRVELPYAAGESPEEGAATARPEITNLPAEIVIEDPSFDDIEAVTGEGLEQVHALYISAVEMTEGKLDYYVNQIEIYGANALIIEVKPESGRLIHISTAAGALAFDTSGSIDLAEAASMLKEKEIRLIASISCCVDELTATRNVPVALRDGNGSPWSDADGRYWLDARNRGIRGYLSELVAELAGMGFDEIMLTNLAYPAVEAGEGGPFLSDSGAVSSSVGTAVGNLALSLSRLRESLGVSVSVLCPAAPDALSGQDAELFLKVFDRLYCPTSPDALESDRSAVESVMAAGSILTRFVPVMSSAADSGSWAVKTQ